MGIFQARILEWVAMPSFIGSSQPWDQTQVSLIAGGLFTIWDTRLSSKVTIPHIPITQKHILTPVFVAALFTIAKKWKQPKCPSTNEWIKIWCACMRAKSLQLCASVCNPMDCSLPGSSVHGILQARILEWVAVPSSKGSFRPRDRTYVSYVSCIGKWILYH